MKTNQILLISAVAVVGWYFYRKSKGLPFLPGGTVPVTPAPQNTGTAATQPPASGLAGQVTGLLNTANTASGDLNSILNNLSGTAGALGVGSTTDPSAEFSGGL
jgi:hypothetical protein